jgi:2-dehydro-3-deoxyphosphogluconate aldolase/(4S)-4-hydroxy-2-oxoglutarate aldolase
MSRAEVCRRLEASGIVPVVRVSRRELALRAVEALAAAGCEAVEITLTVPDALAIIRELSARALVGAGTVTSSVQAQAALEAGARFIVSPGLDAGIVRAAQAGGAPAIAGALTPSEIMAAIRAGADWVKIFPCSALGGATYLRALRGPFPGVRLLPTGGVTLASAPDYIAAGAVALGVGSELIAEGELATGDLASTSDRARAFIASVRAARSKLANDDDHGSAGRDPETPYRGV